MACFQVIEAGEGLEQSILRGLAGRDGGTARHTPGGPALVVVSPEAARLGLPLPETCRTVLLPGRAGRAAGGLRASSAVSYGTSPKDTLTVSSREEGRLWAALQRELVTVDGQVVERQEFPLELGRDGRVLSALAVAGALLLLGVPPEELN